MLLWYNMEDKLQAYPPEYIYNVQRLVSSGWSGFRYRFRTFCSETMGSSRNERRKLDIDSYERETPLIRVDVKNSEQKSETPKMSAGLALESSFTPVPPT
jgi:hypothetical protein